MIQTRDSFSLSMSIPLLPAVSFLYWLSVRATHYFILTAHHLKWISSCQWPSAFYKLKLSRGKYLAVLWEGRLTTPIQVLLTPESQCASSWLTKEISIPQPFPGFFSSGPPRELSLTCESSQCLINLSLCILLRPPPHTGFVSPNISLSLRKPDSVSLLSNISF